MNKEAKTPSSDLGDVPFPEFRRQLHELADWVADYREHIGEIRVAPSAKPGAVQAALPQQPPETGERFEEIFDDIKKLIVPNMLHWGHPEFMAYFGCTTTA